MVEALIGTACILTIPLVVFALVHAYVKEKWAGRFSYTVQSGDSTVSIEGENVDEAIRFLIMKQQVGKDDEE
jgi:hypothetical protein